MTVHQKGLSRVDFDEAKHIAEITGFDISTCVKKKRACGPGPKYYENDKRYYVLMLLKHIETLKASDPDSLTEEVQAWYARAQKAAQEYREIENRTWCAWQKNQAPPSSSHD